MRQELEEERRLATAVGRLEGEVLAAGRAREEVPPNPTPQTPNDIEIGFGGERAIRFLGSTRRLALAGAASAVSRLEWEVRAQGRRCRLKSDGLSSNTYRQI